ncbi:MAG: VOC family protein [Cyanobacteria bacterium P01_A01_bin.84]
MEVIQCLHTAILVTDLEKSEHFYGKVIGLPKVERSMKFPGSWFQVGEFQIHLIVAPSVSKETSNEKWGRNPHLAFSVSDLESMKKLLVKYDCPIQPSSSGRAALFTKDPDGNIIELAQVI